ncbi:MAG: TonB C-terminal domain-containing protein, partial [Candidatus Gastranaerophilales bacterium]|nr:TonB C-terminal domain-containing protein [Candidatus Gastranaerophilales bacterium]
VIEEVQEELAPISENIQQEELIDEVIEEVHEEFTPVSEDIQQEELIDEVIEEIHEELAPIPENIQQEEITDEVIEEIHEEFTPVSEDIQQEELIDEVIEEVQEELAPISENIQQEELAAEITEDVQEETAPISEDIQQEELIDEVIEQEEITDEVIEEVQEELAPISENIQQEEITDEVIEEVQEELAPISENIQQYDLKDTEPYSDIFNESPLLNTEELNTQYICGELSLNDEPKLESLEGEIKNIYKPDEKPITPETSYFSNFIRPESLDDKISYQSDDKQIFTQKQFTETNNLPIKDTETPIEDKESSQEDIEALLMGIDDVEIVGNLKNINVGSGRNAIINFTIVKKEINPLKIAASVIIATSLSLSGYAYWKYNYILTKANPDSTAFKTLETIPKAQSPMNNKLANTETPEVSQNQAPNNDQNQVQQTQQPPVKINKASTKHTNINDDIERALITQVGPVKISNISWEVSASLASDSIFKNYLMVTGQALKSALSRDLTMATERAKNNVVKVHVILDLQGNIQDSKIQISSGSKQVDDLVLQTLKNTLNYTKLPSIQTKKKQIKAGLIVNL